MKIIVVSHLYPSKLNPYYGKFIQDQYNILKQEPGIEIDLIVPTPYSLPFTKRWNQNHSELLNIDSSKNRLFYLSFPKKNLPHVIASSLSNNILNILEKKDLDLVHVHWIYPDGLAIPALKKNGFKTLLTIHGSDWYNNLNSNSLSPLIKRTLLAADKILYAGPQLKHDIETVLPELTHKSELIYNVVDSEKYNFCSKKEKEKKKKNFNWNSKKIHALTVANIRPEKGVDILIKAILKNKNLKNVIFHLIGKPEYTAFSNQIINLVESSPSKNIIIHPPVPPEKLIDYYQAADLYISPSRRESFGLALTEGCFCGLPFISTSTGIAPVLSNAGCGLVIKEKDFDQLDLIIKELLATVSIESQQILKKKFGKKAFLDKILQSYQSI